MNDSLYLFVQDYAQDNDIELTQKQVYDVVDYILEDSTFNEVLDEIIQFGIEAIKGEEK